MIGEKIVISAKTARKVFYKCNLDHKRQWWSRRIVPICSLSLFKLNPFNALATSRERIALIPRCIWIFSIRWYSHAKQRRLKIVDDIFRLIYYKTSEFRLKMADDPNRDILPVKEGSCMDTVISAIGSYPFVSAVYNNFSWIIYSQLCSIFLWFATLFSIQRAQT